MATAPFNDPRIDMKDFYLAAKAAPAPPPGPDTPGNLKAYDLGRAVKLTWDEVPGITTYIVSRSQAKDGFFFNVGYAAENRFIDADPPEGCWYKVQSSDGESISKPSPPIQAKASPSADAPPP